MKKGSEDKNIKNWVDFWKSSKGAFDNKSDSEQAEFWDTRWSITDTGISKKLKPGKKKKSMDEILEMLEEAGFKIKGSRILDIGSGPGAASIPFAEAGAKVTALDISAAALERLKAYTDKKGLDVKTITASWWTTDIDRLNLRNQFDLVFVTNSPAVKDVDGFDRMLACSKGFGFYSFFIQNHGYGPMIGSDVVQKVLKGAIPKNTSKKGSLFTNAFLYLYLKGYRPVVHIHDNKRNISMPWEEAADHTISSLEHFEPCTATVKRRIREYYKSSAVDGIYKENRSVYSGMMAWKMK
jgi:SAM-dependent methyltransferase